MRSAVSLSTGHQTSSYCTGRGGRPCAGLLRCLMLVTSELVSAAAREATCWETRARGAWPERVASAPLADRSSGDVVVEKEKGEA